MRISIIRETEIENIILPSSVFGSFWITDKDINGLDKNLISIEARDGKWCLISNSEAYYVKNGMAEPYVVLGENQFYQIMKKQGNSRIIIYCSPLIQNYEYLSINDNLDNGITIGKEGCLINCKYLLGPAATIKRENNKIYLTCLDEKIFVYKNNVAVNKKEVIRIGDSIFIQGIKCFLMVSNKKYYIAVNNPAGQVSFGTMSIGGLPDTADAKFTPEEDELEMAIYKENDYFHKTPRFHYDIEPLSMKIDPPPAREKEDETPVLLTVGPMLSMSMVSLVTAYTATNNVLSGKSDWKGALPSLVMAGAMLATVFIWPIFNKRYEKHRRKKNEKERQNKYKAYIETKKETIRKAIEEQSSILKNNYPTTKECEQIILNKYTNLWQRRIIDNDFLEVNLGYGNLPMEIDLSFPEDHFSMVEDNLKNMLSELGNEPKVLNGVPVVYNLYEKRISGIVGESSITTHYIKDLIIQLVSSHSYDNLKIVVLSTKSHENEWNFIKKLPHIFSDDKKIRFFGTNNDEYKEICYYLDRIYTSRAEKSSNGIQKDNLDSYYLIITDNFRKIQNYDVINKVLTSKFNQGFGIIINDRKITNLPDQCDTFIEISDDHGEVHNSANQTTKFTFDLQQEIDYMACSKILSNIPIDITTESEGILPNKIGFLEMYDVGKIEQLNSLTRWKNNNPVLHLESIVGVGKNGENVSIDLHEKFHGPHGLIAGMTGSGKSEFIITYILSMAINYHPYEVQFILIDYKGGGLAGAFENKTTGVKLPHLVGTITNLDKVEIKRSLASLESELKRRQSLFNEARELSDESTMDIYKYQKMYREGIVKTPMSHLFIISDEFAELKQQQPEFMEQLIQTARIGRSLGVHLILATQKPSGVVDPQIWSNTRFRVCLRVQDKGDSQEIIKAPDAAYLTQTGRFYFQVGLNEVFVLGQAAYAGGKYIPNEKVVKNIDTSIKVINNIGYVTKSIDTKEKKEVATAKGEELGNIVKYLRDLAVSQKIVTTPLWLENIPSHIEVAALKEKYNYTTTKNILNPIVGEYDIPDKQKQELFTLPITEEGNVLLYGAAGAGKENFITTMIYSSMLYNDASEVNYYILDFGSGALRMFNNSPLVGDILNADDTDKVANLFKKIQTEIDERKELFASYNGDYISYIKNSGKTVPNIVVVINNYEAYQEIFGKYDDLMNALTRDCTKYGIYFVLALNTPNGIRFKLKQNFQQVYTLQQNSDDDYTTVMGNVHKIYPSKIFGRGILRKENIYEFQTAFATERDKVSQTVKELSDELSKTATSKAEKIPVLPDTVSYVNIAKEIGKDASLIIGIDKNTLDMAKYNFVKASTTLISSIDQSLCIKLVNPLINQILLARKTNLMVINADEYAVDETYTKYYKYKDNKFDDAFSEIMKTLSDAKAIYDANNNQKSALKNMPKHTCIILGMNAFKNKLSEDNKLKLSEMFSIAKETGIMHFILVDGIDQLKKIELESWYKQAVNNDCGIWIGNGINDQFTIKVNQRIEEMKEDIPDNFCFILNHGRPTYVKYVEQFPLKTN